MISKILFIFTFLIRVKSENWWSKVTGYDTEDHNHGYAGASFRKAVDFYLCGKKKFRVHYEGDDKSTWSKNFSNCDPVGIGKSIDGICIYSHDSYKGRLYRGQNWMGTYKGCNISDDDFGYVGELGTPLACLAIFGSDEYRIGYLADGEKPKSSYEKCLAERIILNIFGDNVNPILEYENENKIDFGNKNKLFDATVQLLHNNEINTDKSEVKIIVSQENMVYSNWGFQITNYLNKRFKENLNFDINEEKRKFETMIADQLMNGIVTIISFLNKGKIQFELVTKPNYDFTAFRGGCRFNFFMKNDEKLISFIKKAIKILLRYSPDIEERKNILDKLKYFNEIFELDEIIKLMPFSYSAIIQIIFLYIIKS